MKIKNLIIAITFLCSGKAFAQSNFVSPICTCPAQSSCNSSCTFSSCCLCWDPKTSEGTCGCFWGVSVCKSAKKPNAQLVANSTATVYFKFDAFNQYLNFLSSKNIASDKIKPVYQALTGKYGDHGASLQIDAADMDAFTSAYISIMDALPDAEKAIANTYIRSVQ